MIRNRFLYREVPQSVPSTVLVGTLNEVGSAHGVFTYRIIFRAMYVKLGC